MKNKLLEHFGHKIVIAKYGSQNVSLECETCNEVIKDYELLQVHNIER